MQVKNKKTNCLLFSSQFIIHNSQFITFALINTFFIMEQYSTRQNKVARLVQKELSELVRRESKTLFRGKLISVTTVRVTRDLSLARCYLSIFPSDGAADVVKDINTHKGLFRRNLGILVRHQLRVVPALEFFIDDSLDYIDNIDKALKN
jgi:ribosome-binding factor A